MNPSTMNEMKIGLTLGKFAPLHKGHQYLIETALQEMDKLIVIVYDAPEVTSIPFFRCVDHDHEFCRHVFDGPQKSRELDLLDHCRCNRHCPVFCKRC